MSSLRLGRRTDLPSSHGFDSRFYLFVGRQQRGPGVPDLPAEGREFGG